MTRIAKIDAMEATDNTAERGNGNLMALVRDVDIVVAQLWSACYGKLRITAEPV